MEHPSHLYPCPFGPCKYGGTKGYNYGFVSGRADYCRLAKKWVADLVECPKRTIPVEEMK